MDGDGPSLKAFADCHLVKYRGTLQDSVSEVGLMATAQVILPTRCDCKIIRLVPRSSSIVKLFHIDIIIFKIISIRSCAPLQALKRFLKSFCQSALSKAGDTLSSRQVSSCLLCSYGCLPSDWKWDPSSEPISFGKIKTKSYRAKSDVYGSHSSVGVCSSTKTWRTEISLCTDALSYCKS
jgi:hypothetical protein